MRFTGITPQDHLSFEALARQLRHRGPDGSGVIDEPQALLGMHRLSIMDPQHGWQPFWSEDGRWGVLGNGEIYNAAVLRGALEGRGHKFSTRSDIEVVPHLLEEHGNGAFLHLRGMFALCIIDRDRKEVLLVRDRLGEKPLHYYRTESAVVISSEQSALVRSGVVPLKVDTSQLAGYLLHGYTPEPFTLLSDVRKVPAAHYVTISLTDAAISEHRYWDPFNEVGAEPLSDEEIALAIDEAIVSTCTSDVPIGIALSGGLDSSIVASAASKARTDIHAFTIGYSDDAPDESASARAFAEYLGIPCTTTILHTDEIAREFAMVCGARDEPISDLAGPALNAIPRAAREAGIPVLLTGIGGDELFWGYDWIRQLAVWSTNYLHEKSTGIVARLPRFTQRPTTLQSQADWVASLGGLLNDRALRSFMSAGSGLVVPLPFYEFQPGRRGLSRAMHQIIGEPMHAREAEFFGRADGEWMAAYFTIASNETYLRVNSFVQVDRLSMRHSVESRTPLADAELVSKILSGRLASRDHLEPPKARLRRIAGAQLPAEVVNRPKRGFTPPVRDWARAIWQVNKGALSAEATISLFATPASLTRQWIHSPTTRTGRVNQVALRLLTLELWLRSLT